MVRNGTVEINDNGIKVMNFVSLNNLLSIEYPGYRIKSNMYDVAGSLLSMPVGSTLNNLGDNIYSQLNGGDYPPAYTPPSEENMLYKDPGIKMTPSNQKS